MKIFKTLLLMFAGALLFVACEQGGASESTDLQLEVTKSKIFNNGEDYTEFIVTLGGKVLTEGYEIYNAATFSPANLTDNRFTSTMTGTFSFKAVYGTLQSNIVKVNVRLAPPSMTEPPVDNNPEKTNFYRRILFTQFTGTGCGYCPYMTNAVAEARADVDTDSKMVFTAVHHFNSDDPSYFTGALTLANVLGVGLSAPAVRADLTKVNGMGCGQSAKAVKNFVTSYYIKDTAKAGVAVNSKLYTAEKFVVCSALVKVNTDGEYRVGAWLLEDKVAGVQSNYDNLKPYGDVNFNIHNGSVRVADSRQGTEWTGTDLGVMKAGEAKSMDFAIQLEDGWKSEDLYLVLFVSTKNAKGTWVVNNAVYAAVDGVTDFVYDDVVEE